VFNRGASGGRGAAHTDYTFDRGGIRKASATTSAVDFGRSKQWEDGGAVTIWAHHMPTNFAGFPTPLSCCASGALNGWELGINSSGNARLFCSSGTSASIVSTASLSTNQIITQMGVVLPGVAWGGLYINGVLQTVTGSATPNSPTYATSLKIANRAGTNFGNLIVWQALVWNKVQSQQLAVLLDRDPDLMWWWPGKEANRTIFLPGAAAGSGAGPLIGPGRLIVGGIHNSGRLVRC